MIFQTKSKWLRNKGRSIEIWKLKFLYLHMNSGYVLSSNRTGKRPVWVSTRAFRISNRNLEKNDRLVGTFCRNSFLSRDWACQPNRYGSSSLETWLYPKSHHPLDGSKFVSQAKVKD